MGDTSLCRRAKRQGGQGRPARSAPRCSGSANICYNVPRAVPELVDAGLLTRGGISKQFHRDRTNFLWGGALPPPHPRRPRRGPPDLRRTSARSPSGCATMIGPGRPAVERFSAALFPHRRRRSATLTGLFLAHLDETFAKRGRPLRPVGDEGPAQTGRNLEWLRHSIAAGWRLPERRFLRRGSGAPRSRSSRSPIKYMISKSTRSTMRAASRDAEAGHRWQGARAMPRANALFLERAGIQPQGARQLALRWMNEAGVFGRFIPRFRPCRRRRCSLTCTTTITVDEHTIHAIDLLSRIEHGELSQDHPLATGIDPARSSSRRVLYVAVLLPRHRQGTRRRSTPILGAEVARIPALPAVGADARRRRRPCRLAGASITC